MDLIPQSKDTDWQTGLKRKIQQSAAYMRSTSSTEISTGCKWKAGRFYQDNGAPNQAGVAIPISDKVDFKLTLIK
jgi:hypothetical protein